MDNDSFYKPSGNIKNINRTYVPDLYRQVAAEMQAEEGGNTPQDSGSESIIKLQKRPLIGVLYSISAGIEGELFPVYIGKNTIGSDLSCDICLRESSVSALHGILLARKQTNEEGNEFVNVILSDNNSNYGTSVNGERLNFERITCTDGDLLAFGPNYVLVLSLFNAIDRLSVAYSFDRIPEPKKIVDNSVLPVQPSGKMTDNSLTSPPSSDNHATNITQVPKLEASSDFYKPTRQSGQDHYNNKTIII